VNAGRRLALTKRRVRWRFGYPSLPSLESGKTGTDCRGEEHEVSLVWSLTSGKKSVVFDNVEVHSSESRQSVFEFSWSRDNQHVYKIVANAAGGGQRQYDLYVDGQSYFDMPKVYELGMPNAGPRSRGIVGSVNEAAVQRSPPPVVAGQAVRRPKSSSEEEADLQRAIRESLAESQAHINRQKSHSFDHHHQHHSPSAPPSHQLPPRQRSNSNPEFDLLTMGVTDLAIGGATAPPQDPSQWDPFGTNQPPTPTHINQQNFQQHHHLQVVTGNNSGAAINQPQMLSPYDSGGGDIGTNLSAEAAVANANYNLSSSTSFQQQHLGTSPQGSQVDKAMKSMVNLDNLNAASGNPFDSVMSSNNDQFGSGKPSLKQLANSTPKNSATPVMMKNDSINLSLSGDQSQQQQQYPSHITPSVSNVSYISNVNSGFDYSASTPTQQQQMQHQQQLQQQHQQYTGYANQQNQQNQQNQNLGRMPFNSPAGPSMMQAQQHGGFNQQQQYAAPAQPPPDALNESFHQTYQQQNYGGF